VRRVNRAAVGTPPSLMGPRSAAARELAAAARHFEAPTGSSFEFDAYKASDVVHALNELFHGKCAYCESRIRAIQPTDVEHFRPKGRVDGCRGHPGYWWLAAIWENLLASCILCNRRTYQQAVELANAPLPHGRDGKFRVGKGDSFPILGAQHARSAAEDHDAEDPALIDPTVREPSDHLQWLEVDGKSLVGPRDRGGQIDLYGLHTYQVFGLNRQGLVEDRTARRLLVQKGFIEVREWLDLGVTVPEPHGATIRNKAFAKLDELKTLAEPHQPYSAMVADLVDQELLSLVAAYQHLFP